MPPRQLKRPHYFRAATAAPAGLEELQRRVVKRHVAPPSIADCLALADDTLAGQPSKPHIERVPGAGNRLARFVVPLELLPSNNPWGRLKGWQKAALIEKLRGHIAPQLAHLRSMALPLPGRPMIRAIRFSSTEGDVDNGWTKLAIDRLTVRSHGLGIIEDDRPSKLNLKVWWEYAPAGKGFGYFEIWSGSTA